MSKPLEDSINPNETFFDLIMNYNFNYEYTDFDKQKGGLSPKLLTKKRTSEEPAPDCGKSSLSTVHASFDNYLDFVNSTYFSADDTASNSKQFRLTSLDKLLNPLRKKQAFGNFVMRIVDATRSGHFPSGNLQV